MAKRAGLAAVDQGVVVGVAQDSDGSLVVGVQVGLCRYSLTANEARAMAASILAAADHVAGGTPLTLPMQDAAGPLYVPDDLTWRERE